MADSLITIRRVQADEIDAFKRIRLEALRAEPASFASSYEDWVGLSDEEWRQRLADPVFIVFRDGEAVGITGLLRQRPSKLTHRATIVMVYLRQNLRGTGLAAMLLRAVADHAHDIGIRQLELTVSAENPAAIHFYRKEGFSEFGRVPGGTVRDGREVDDVLMARRLVE